MSRSIISGLLAIAAMVSLTANAFIKAQPQFDFRPKLKTITAPVLPMQGRQDLPGEANICDVHLLVKNSALKFINKCGPMPWLEQTEQTWQIVHQFLHSLSK